MGDNEQVTNGAACRGGDLTASERQWPAGAMSRRRFAQWMVAAGVGTALASCGSGPGVTPGAQPDQTARASLAETLQTAGRETPQSTRPETATPARSPAYLAVARGADPEAITRAALAAIGGIERFVKSGDAVIVKPNICVDYRTPEFGATTHPLVVGCLVKLCLGAGARSVRVMDSPFGGSPESAYVRSGIAEAVAAAGGVMEVMNQAKFRETDIPEGRDITRWPVYQEILSADLVIDVPVAKHHGNTRLSLAGKNLMGVVLNRGRLHADLGQRIADLVSLVRPRLTVVDAVRTLMAHGPTGGNLDDVRLTNTVIASHDIVAADAYAATMFGLSGPEIGYVQAAADMGLGTLDLKAIQVEEVAVD